MGIIYSPLLLFIFFVMFDYELDFFDPHNNTWRLPDIHTNNPTRAVSISPSNDKTGKREGLSNNLTTQLPLAPLSL